MATDRVRVDLGQVDSVYRNLIGAVTALPLEGDGVLNSARAAADAASSYGSDLDEALRLFGERWDREMDFISQDVFAAAANIKSAANAIKQLDEGIANEITY